MLDACYSPSAVQTAVDLANTLKPIKGEDALETVEQLRDFLDDHSPAGPAEPSSSAADQGTGLRRDLTRADLAEVHALRETVRAVLERASTDAGGAAALVNDGLRRSRATMPRLSTPCFEGQYCGLGVAGFWRRHKQPIECRHPNRGRRARRAGKLHHRRVAITILLLVDGDAVRASRINTVAVGVVPKIIDARDTIELDNLFTGLGVEDDKLRRVASAGEESTMTFVKRQCCDCLSARPSCDLLSLVTVYHAKLLLTQERHENARAFALDLDAARQGVSPDVADMSCR